MEKSGSLGTKSRRKRLWAVDLNSVVGSATVLGFLVLVSFCKKEKG